MKYNQYIIISVCYLLFSCSGFKDVAATIQGENIYLSEIYQNIDRAAFNALTPEKKRAFVRRYAVYKILTTKPKRELEEIRLFIEDEKNRLKHDFIVQKVEKYIANNLTVTDSVLDFVENAINTDIYVEAITVTYKFSLGKAFDRTKEEAYKRAKIIYNRLFSGDLSYREALSIYSESSPSKIKGNEMGQLSFGLMPKNFNDVVWTSPEGKLQAPLETPIGFHVVIVEVRIPKTGKNKTKIDQVELKKELMKGKYGYQEENFSNFFESLYQIYNVSLNQVELYKTWDSVREIEGVNSISGIPVTTLKEINPNIVLGKIGTKEITLGWFVNRTNDFSFYENVSINSGFSFNKFISDVLARHLIVRWYNDNKKLFPGVEIAIKQKSVNKIYSLYLDKKLEQNTDLTKEIILNRLLMNNNVQINY